jgi:D-3-phosphoglycerate dehydrogenase
MRNGRLRVVVTSPGFDREGSQAAGRLQASGFDVTYSPLLGRREDRELIELLHGAVAIIASSEPLSAAVIESAPDLRLIARTGVGTDSVDLAAARSHGITVINTPYANVTTCADHAVALILAILRSLVELDAMLRAGTWNKSPQGRLVELRDLRIGIVGFGEIGKAVARRLDAFGAEIRASDTRARAARGVTIVPLADLLAWSDLVTLHVPLLDGTRQLINAAALEAMRPGAVLVNTSRGGVIDQDALVDALACGRLRAAALDVFEQEPLGDSPLLTMSNVLLTPHVGGLSEQAEERMLDGCVRAVVELLAAGTSADWPPGEPYGVVVETAT